MTQGEELRAEGESPIESLPKLEWSHDKHVKNCLGTEF